jgi:hypothetical protein
MDGKRLLASITASVDQSLLLRNEYLVTEKWRVTERPTSPLRNSLLHTAFLVAFPPWYTGHPPHPGVRDLAHGVALGVRQSRRQKCMKEVLHG